MVTVVRGPDIGTIGWIPHPFHFPGLPSPGFQTYLSQLQPAFRKRSGFIAITQLFKSGNFPPPGRGWTGEEEFLGYRWLREFRGILCLSNVVMTKRDNNPCEVTFNSLRGDFVGYTPLRLLSNVNYRTGRTGIVIGPIVSPTSDGVQIVYEVHYRVGRLIDLVSRAMLGHWAPYAWSGCIYDLKIDGRWQVQFTGSAIPSHTSWINWHQEKKWDLTGANDQEIKAFLQAGRGVSAPPFSAVPIVTGHVAPVTML